MSLAAVRSGSTCVAVNRATQGKASKVLGASGGKCGLRQDWCCACLCFVLAVMTIVAYRGNNHHH